MMSRLIQFLIMKSFAKYLLLVSVMLFAGFSLVSCGDDEEDIPGGGTPSAASIIGIWYEDESTPECYTYFNFTSATEGVLVDYDANSAEPEYKESFTYVYDSTAKTLSLTSADGYQEVYHNVKVTSNKMEITDIEGEYYVFYRYNQK